MGGVTMYTYLNRLLYMWFELLLKMVLNKCDVNLCAVVDGSVDLVQDVLPEQNTLLVKKSANKQCLIRNWVPCLPGCQGDRG